MKFTRPPFFLPGFRETKRTISCRLSDSIGQTQGCPALLTLNEITDQLACEYEDRSYTLPKPRLPMTREEIQGRGFPLTPLHINWHYARASHLM